MPSFMPVPGSQPAGALPPSVGYSLDSVSSLFAAFAPHRLRKGHTGKAMKVRNSAGTLLDIGFTPNGELDQVALLAHCGSGDGSVNVWYDQSGNAQDISDDTIAAALNITDGSIQPRIVTAGVVEKINGRPAVRFRGTDILQRASVAFPAAASGVLLQQPIADAGTSDLYVASWGHASTPHYDPFRHNPSTQSQQFNYSPSSGSVTLITVPGAALAGVPAVQSFRDDGAAVKISNKGVQIGTGAITRAGTAPNRLQIGGHYTSTITRGHLGLIGAVVLTQNDQALTNVIADLMLRSGLLT